MGLPVQLPCGSVLLGGVSTIRSTALRLRFFMAAPPVLAVRCWDGISELRRNSEVSARLLEASEFLTKITVLGRLSVISMRRSAKIMQQRRTAVAAVKSGVAPQRISNISEIKTVGFTRKTYRFCVIARFVQKQDVDSARKRLHPAKTVCFQTKPLQLCVIARPPRAGFKYCEHENGRFYEKTYRFLPCFIYIIELLICCLNDLKR